MRVIYSTETSPYLNLAAEEYLLEKCDGDIFMLWRNTKSVIIGKNQNAYGELNIEYCKENGIAAVRRLTGGGAVFHDVGNINFTFITSCTEDGEIDFFPFSEKICRALRSFGVSCAPNGRNDIEAEGYKISGNAQCRYHTKELGSRLLHHGTLLFSADMSSLEKALLVSEKKLSAKGIKSVRSRVKNISELPTYNGPSDCESFAMELLFAMHNQNPDTLTAEEISGIKRLAEEKYSTWEWNFGMSPPLSGTSEGRFSWGGVTISVEAKHGIIEKIHISGDFFAKEDIGLLEESLVGTRLERESLLSALCEAPDYIHGASAEDIATVILDI